MRRLMRLFLVLINILQAKFLIKFSLFFLYNLDCRIGLRNYFILGERWPISNKVILFFNFLVFLFLYLFLCLGQNVFCRVFSRFLLNKFQVRIDIIRIFENLAVGNNVLMQNNALVLEWFLLWGNSHLRRLIRLERLSLNNWLFSETIIDVAWVVTGCRRGAMLGWKAEVNVLRRTNVGLRWVSVLIVEWKIAAVLWGTGIKLRRILRTESKRLLMRWRTH